MLSRLGIHNVEDLLLHFPVQYQDRTRVTPVARLWPGIQAQVQGTVELTSVVFTGKRSMLVRISDGTGFLDLRFFYFSAAQQARLTRGTLLRCFGQVRTARGGLEMIHPEYQVVDSLEATTASAGYTPVYPSTTGMHQATWRKLLRQAIDRAREDSELLQEFLPMALLERENFPNLQDAIVQVHVPESEQELALLRHGNHPALERLAFEELLVHHLCLRIRRQQCEHRAAWPVAATSPMVHEFVDQLPFQLTPGQTQVLQDIGADLGKAFPMQRLVQGDVGCGKTVVAMIAALHVVSAGLQVAVMAPTEILAEQHLQSFASQMAGLDITIALLTGAVKGRARERLLTELRGGKVHILIGTHALFQEDIQFQQLALVVVDEQHRFGVHQRLALRNKGVQAGRYPHQLIMTATPIPRTLAMTLYADLDCSIIDTLPVGRQPVETVVMPQSRRDQVIERITHLCAAGRQIFWVCPLIEESDSLQCQAAENAWQQLTEQLPDICVGMIHGRMPAQEKERIMGQFSKGEIQVLVATTVIEVGVNVPNACLMVIENAERMGLSQLHQLRGRVGRGADASVCVLLYQSPLSQLAKERLAVMRSTNDGFVIARKDLELRGPGEFFGTRQTGMLAFKIADLGKHQHLLPRVQRSAAELLMHDQITVNRLIQRWNRFALAYSQV